MQQQQIPYGSERNVRPMKIRCIKADNKDRKIKVAAYCRVSTKTHEQEESLETQKRVYTERINLRSDWEMAGIYSDSLSGLRAENRPGFMQMIQDCRDGKIDRILCKSVSRFSRNVIECQRYTDILRSMNIVVEFEKENIHTDDPTSRFVFSLMCSIAQNESRSISENIRMGYQARYERGEYNIGNNRILGYNTVNKKLVPNEDEWIIEMIFKLFLEGKTFKEIAECLKDAGAYSKQNKGKFAPSTISYILHNETYVGDKLLHKNPPRDLITKRKLQDSEYEKYYLKEDHEPIIDRETWETVQQKLTRRDDLKEKGLSVRGRESHFLFGRVRCGMCGEYFTRRTFREYAKDENGQPIRYKAWGCKSNKKNKKSMNRNIREDKLLKLIAEKMDWPSFDQKLFEETVECVTVMGNGNISLELKKDNKNTNTTN